jgi:citrate synthase
VSGALTAAEAAERLGVKQATLYAYVSRGVLTRTRAANGRGSTFDADEVERLARRGRPRRPAGAADIIVESQITEITGDRLRYRGHDVIELARTRSFEDVAALLWTGAIPAASTAFPVGEPYSAGAGAGGGPAAVLPTTGATTWQATDAALAVGRAAQAVLPAGVLPLDRLLVIVAAMAATDPLRLHLEPTAVVATARGIVAGMVGCLPPAETAGSTGPGEAGRGGSASGAAGWGGSGSVAGRWGGGAGGSVAERLWGRLCARRASPALLRAVEAALILLADHELAASTLAARAAASVRADPYAVVATGLGAIGGALHGGASLGTESLLAAADGPADVPRVVGELLRRGEKIPGFGHLVYRGGDPRAVVLLDLVRRAAPKSGQLAVAEAVLAEARRKSLPEPNIDFALATMVRVAGMIRGAGEATFAIARTAGWIAHALEAYTGTQIRPRAVYTGAAFTPAQRLHRRSVYTGIGIGVRCVVIRRPSRRCARGAGPRGRCGGSTPGSGADRSPAATSARPGGRRRRPAQRWRPPRRRA